MLIAFPDEEITQFQGVREGWIVREGFAPGWRPAWDPKHGGQGFSVSLAPV